MNDVPNNVTVEAWNKLIGTVFTVEPEGPAPVALKLGQVVPRPQVDHGAQRWEGFSLVFLGPSDPMLPQKTYHLQHQELGCFDLFIVPTGKRPGGYEYEAVFNRLRPLELG